MPIRFPQHVAHKRHNFTTYVRGVFRWKRAEGNARHLRHSHMEPSIRHVDVQYLDLLNLDPFRIYINQGLVCAVICPRLV